MSVTQLRCSYCEHALSEEELRDPQLVDNEAVCDECYYDWYATHSFVCATCGEQWEDGEESDVFVLFDKDHGEPGMYKATRFPFYAQPLIGCGWFYDDAIRRIGPVPQGVKQEGYEPCEWVCKECVSVRKRARLPWGKRPTSQPPAPNPQEPSNA